MTLTAMRAIRLAPCSTALLLLSLCSLQSGCQVGRTMFQIDSDSQVPFFGIDLLPGRKTSAVGAPGDDDAPLAAAASEPRVLPPSNPVMRANGSLPARTDGPVNLASQRSPSIRDESRSLVVANESAAAITTAVDIPASEPLSSPSGARSGWLDRLGLRRTPERIPLRLEASPVGPTAENGPVELFR